MTKTAANQSIAMLFLNKTTSLIHLIRVDWLMCDVIEVNSCKPYVNVIPSFKLASCIL